jgi:hypothetical protein
MAERTFPLNTLRFSQEGHRMRVQRDRNDYVLGLFALITVVLASQRLVAQRDLLPAVDLQRNLALTSEVWPGDFNGDGVTDVVASRSAAPRGFPIGLQVVLGRGDGTFGPPILTDFAGNAVAVGDFNGDRRLDVVAVASPPSSNLVVLAGNGNGTFGVPVSIGQTLGEGFVLAADFNGDDRRDIVAAAGPGFNVYPGNGDLTFQPPFAVPLGDLILYGGIAIDVDNDGDRDVVAAAEPPAAVVFRNDGAFSFSVTSLPLPFDFPAPLVPTDATARDLDGDGAVDIVVSAAARENDQYTSGVAYVLKGRGDGTFDAPVSYATGKGAFQIVVGDFHARRPS